MQNIKTLYNYSNKIIEIKVYRLWRSFESQSTIMHMHYVHVIIALTSQIWGLLEGIRFVVELISVRSREENA